MICHLIYIQNDSDCLAILRISFEIPYIRASMKSNSRVLKAVEYAVMVQSSLLHENSLTLKNKDQISHVNKKCTLPERIKIGMLL